MAALGGNLSRSGSLPPPFIVPQGEEPVTPDSKSGRSSSLLERVSAPPLSLRTGDTVSEHSTACTSDDAKYACTGADATSQPPADSTAEYSFDAEPAPWKDVRTPNLQQEQVKKRKVSLEESPSAHDGDYGSSCLQQFQPKENAPGLTLQIATADVQCAQRAKTALQSKPSDCGQPSAIQAAFHAADACTDEHACESRMVKSAVATPEACEAAGPPAPSANSVCGVPAVRRPTKGVVVPNNSNLIAAIRHRRARTSEPNSASVSSALPPPSTGKGAVQQTGDVPPPPKFVSTSSSLPVAQKSTGLNNTGMTLPDPESFAASMSQNLPIPPPSTWSCPTTPSKENDAGGFVHTTGACQGVRSKFSSAASNGSFLSKPNAAVQQAKSAPSTSPAKGSMLGAQQEAQPPASSSTRSQMMVSPGWANHAQTHHARGWNGSGHMQQGSSHMGHTIRSGNSSSQSMHTAMLARPHLRPNPMQQHRPPCPPPGSLAYAQTQGWHDVPHSGHPQQHMATQGHIPPAHQQSAYSGGPGALHRHPAQHFHPANQPYHGMPPPISHPFQAGPQPHSMAMQPWPPVAPGFGPQIGMGLMNHGMPEQSMGLMGGPWGGRGLV